MAKETKQEAAARKAKAKAEKEAAEAAAQEQAATVLQSAHRGNLGRHEAEQTAVDAAHRRKVHLAISAAALSAAGGAYAYYTYVLWPAWNQPPSPPAPPIPPSPPPSPQTPAPPFPPPPLPPPTFVSFLQVAAALIGLTFLAIIMCSSDDEQQESDVPKGDPAQAALMV